MAMGRQCMQALTPNKNVNSGYPKIKSAIAIDNQHLLIEFDNDEKKFFSCFFQYLFYITTQAFKCSKNERASNVRYSGNI